MKTRSEDKPAEEHHDEAEEEQAQQDTAVKAEQTEQKPASSSEPDRKLASKRKEQDSDNDDVDKEDNKEKEKPKTSSRKKPRTEGVAEPGELPPDAFGKVTDKDAERKHGVIEHGKIYFLYRPRVEVEEVNAVEWVAHFHILLLPSNVPDHYRLLTIGRKTLPQRHAESKQKRFDIYWGKCLDLGPLSALRERLDARTYETKTAGERHIGPARVAGYGTYVIHSSPASGTPANSKNMSAVYETHLAYALETPHELGKVQHALRIETVGSLQIQLKDPNQPSTNPSVRDVGKNKQPQFPPALKKLFTTKFIPANPASLLNYSGAELLFIPSHQSVAEQIGDETEQQLRKEAHQDTAHAKKDEGEEPKVKNDDDDDGERDDIDESHQGAEEGHAMAQAALKKLGVEGVVKAGPLEGFWE